MAKATGNGCLSTPVQALRDVIAELESGEVKANKAFVILLDEREGAYAVNWVQSGMHGSECIALCEVAKMTVMNEMGY
jgi:hypothetical protein